MGSLKYKGIRPIEQHYYMAGSIDSLEAAHRVSKPVISISKSADTKPAITLKRICPETSVEHKNSGVLFCIFNYREDENARKWVKILSPYYKTIVLDSGNDKKCEDFIQFPNIYYSGLFNEMKKIQNKEHYEWIGVITSDVEITDANAKRFIDKIAWLRTTTNVGQWQPALDATSAKRNRKINVHRKLESVNFIEGMITVMRGDIIDLLPMIDTSINKYGMYIDNVVSGLIIWKNLFNIYDNTLQVHHPEDYGYSKDDRATYIKWCLDLKEKLIGHKVSIDNLTGLNFHLSLNPDIHYKPVEIKRQTINAYNVDTVSGVNGKEHPIYLTLTTWKDRLQYLPKFAEQIKKQTVKPDKIILWLSSDEIKKEEVPNISNIEIHWVDKNLKSFKKFLTIQQHPEAYNIIVDDDRLYYPDMIKDLLAESKKYNDKNPVGFYCDICNSKGQPWGENQHDETERNWINDSCIVYPPHVFPMEAFTFFPKIMLNRPLVSDECFLMPFLTRRNIKPIAMKGRGSVGMKALDTCSPMIVGSQTSALHSKFFQTSDTRKNRKNQLIWDIVTSLPGEYYYAYKKAFVNFGNEVDTHGYNPMNGYYSSPTLRYICDTPNRDDLVPQFSEKERYIISITSWAKRIGNVKPVLETILKGNVVPDKIVINLAQEEFPNKENDLPLELKLFIKEHSIIELHWLVHNTKVWKKILPTIMRYPNDCVIGLDDDFSYPQNFLETLKAKHLEKPGVGIAGNKEAVVGTKAHCGCGTLVKHDMFGTYLNDLDDTMVESRADDLFYTYAMVKNGHHYEFCGTLFFTNMLKINEVEGYSKSNKINVVSVWRKIYLPKLR